ncbi:hypothetical protein A3A67_00765 [Candidatus Peribacteria bacterium RIFCSPLOWO2_01_FULL_51_18]|nr:N-6 DNA methylase [Candidatus Woesearchaeota archaeon]OGJ65023.1 MAG: hypothetical protein A3A67_00765 [Candidatus Peribacteria bacterium RIFCSPLOWO2_01_FULL_51_18]HLD78939.1 TaqI-like C-terminal specificity domain-containing protein [Candidatus Nanoarchaeia archaeon]
MEMKPVNTSNLKEVGNKEKAREELISLIKDFENNPDYYKKLSEADVEDKLVNELFVNILGWDKKDYEKRAKVQRGDKRGSADYAFKINDRIVFFLEVKKVTIPLDKEADEQVILYSLSKKVPLAISTNFQQMNIFCVEQEDAVKNVFRTFKTPEDYVNNFSDLWFLSKDSFEQGLLLKKAEDEGRLKKRVSIDKVLLEDFWRVRTLIANDIEKNKPGEYNINEKDEIVQRILDRLIFIRRCEDTGINPENLTLEEIKHIAESRAYSQLKALFSKYDSFYDSGLFTPNKDNDCDIITINGEIIQRLIRYLYESHDGKYKYNFEWIDADVLGQVYEQYLGKILAQTKSGKAKLKEGQAHRKEQGIYYTPTYVVDYIVKNTLGELLKDRKIDARKIKVLDPACGSGSFLIKAFDYMQKHLSNDKEAVQSKLDFQTKDAPTYSIKTDILKNNIFGVDLDNKAVEITKLNLLLKAAEKFRKLPSELDNHIGWGNSLIDDGAFEHPFKWVGDFQEGTFDVVIGNPPYIQLSMESDSVTNYKNYLIKRFGSSMGRLNTFGFFTKLGIDLLKDKGKLGYIIPNTVLTQDYYADLRDIILNSCRIRYIVNFSDLPFKDAVVENVILILEKESNEKYRFSNQVSVIGVNEKLQFIEQRKLSQEQFYSNRERAFLTSLDNKKLKIKENIEKGSLPLRTFVEINQAIALKSDRKKYLSKSKEDSSFKKVLDGRNIQRYGINWEQTYLRYDLKSIHSCKREDIFLKEEKLFFRRVGNGLIACLDESQFYALNTLVVITLKDASKLNLRATLALINSKLMNYYYKTVLKSTKTVFSEIQARQIKELPIKLLSESAQEKLSNLVEKITKNVKRLCDFRDKKTADSAKLEEEIHKTDAEIDEEVYKLYGITEEEKKIIEESLK